MTEPPKQLRPGKVAGPEFSALASDLTWLCVRWSMYKRLFMHTPRRVELLNHAAGTFFHVVEQVLRSDVILGICRLSDQPLTGPKEEPKQNLVLESLVRQVSTETDKALRRNANRLLSKLRREVKPIRDHRNQLLAHRDLEVALGAKPLSPVTGDRIDRSLELCAGIYNTIQSHYIDSETAFEHVNIPKGADALVAFLVDGEDYEVLVKSHAIPVDRWRAAKYRGV